MRKVSVKIVEGEIVVTDPATEWSVSYKHSPAMNGIVVTDLYTDRKAKVGEKAAFMARAFATASARARKLGWVG